jgi:hypothetical protein
MWWYKDRKDKPDEADEAAPLPSAGRLAKTLSAALANRPADPDLLMAMAFLVDSRITFADGEVLDGMTWADAEKVVEDAAGKGALRLYNAFAKDYGDGVTTRPDLTPEQTAALDRVRAAIAAAEGIAAQPR